MMKTLAAFAIFLAALAPVVSAQATASFAGKWEGTMTPIGPDGTDGTANTAAFNFTQKGKVLEGTAGPAQQQWKIENGAVNAGKATFEVQQPNGGPLLKFTLSIIKGRLQGEMVGERDGVTRKGRIDAAKAAAVK
jgi:hypothetical protein